MILVKPSFEILSDLNGDRILRAIESAGRTCYKSEDKITETSAPRFCGMILSKQHESVVEHESMTVKFVVDRGVSHELVRHRLCSFSQESTRYCNYGKAEHVTFVAPPWCPDLNLGEYSRLYVIHNWHEYINGSYATARWLLSMAQAEDSYLNLLADGWQPQQARAVLPNSLKTEIVVTANLREWRHIFRLRTSKAAHPQMRQIMEPLLMQVRAMVPVLFDNINDE